jgi:hypothetical protein
MTYREFFKFAVPPAPEHPALFRLRASAAGLCLVSAIVLGFLRAIGNPLPTLSAGAVFLSYSSFAVLVYLFVRKVRHDVDYWTPERVEQYSVSRRCVDRIDPVIDVAADPR